MRKDQGQELLVSSSAGTWVNISIYSNNSSIFMILRRIGTPQSPPPSPKKKKKKRKKNGRVLYFGSRIVPEIQIREGARFQGKFINFFCESNHQIQGKYYLKKKKGVSLIASEASEKFLYSLQQIRLEICELVTGPR